MPSIKVRNKDNTGWIEFPQVLPTEASRLAGATMPSESLQAVLNEYAVVITLRLVDGRLVASVSELLPNPEGEGDA